MAMERRPDGVFKETHGLSRSREYNIWANIKDRCYNPNCKGYKNYGARGICLAESWLDFNTFMFDMGKRPSSRHSIERLNVNGNYSKENCVWALPKQQGRNRRNSVIITYNGITKHLYDWAEDLGVSWQAMASRYKRNWPTDRLLKEYLC